MTRRDEHPLDDLVRRAVRVRDEDVADAWSGSDAAEALLQEMTMTPHDTTGQTVTERTHRPVRRATASAVLAGLLAAAVLLVASPFGAPAPAIAGWDPEPAAQPDPALVAAAPETCTVLHDALRESDPEMSATMPPQIATDQRGNSGVAVFASDTEYIVCHLIQTDDGWQHVGGSGGGYDANGFPDDPPFDAAADIVTVDAQHSWAVSGTAITTVFGRIDGDVDRVTLNREDGMAVEAQTADGTFVAWWPSQHGVGTAVALDDDGTELATVTPRAGQTGFVTP